MILKSLAKFFKIYERWRNSFKLTWYSSVRCVHGIVLYVVYFNDTSDLVSPGGFDGVEVILGRL